MSSDNNIIQTFNGIASDNSTEVKFYVSDQYDSTGVRKAGDISVILSEGTSPSTSIWLKDTHIASGYGFDSASDKRTVMELLSNPKFIELLENSTKDEEEEEPEIPEVEIPSSSIYVDGKEIKFNEGILKAVSWIDIKDTVFNVSSSTNSTTNIYQNEEVFLPVYDSLNLNYVEFKYTYTTETLLPDALQYLIYISDKDKLSDSTLLSLPDYVDIANSSLNATGVLSTLRLDLEKSISKSYLDNIHFLESKYVYFVIKDSRNTKITYKRVFKVTFKYPVFKLDNYDSLSFDTAVLSDYTDSSLYINTNRVKFTFNGLLSGESGESIKHYIAIPSAINEKCRLILEQSDIACNFKSKWAGKIDGYDYTILESPVKYYGIVSWLLEIDLD